VAPFLAFTQDLSKVIYTTNAIESLNASVPRADRTRGHFTSVEATKKLIYLTVRETTQS